jgi:anthranilate synthase/aminodeoxychorismate synthase-like glutamine amidotransferase
MRLSILDNRDSFVWNLVHLAAGLGVEVELLEARTTSLAPLAASPPEVLLIGPGPGPPSAATLSLALFEALPRVPILGVCLGHQALALARGATIESTPKLAHGRPVELQHDGTGLFEGLPRPAFAGRYHSLTVCPSGLPSTLEVIARSPEGEVLALADRERPHFGVQFHPESILSNCGHELLANFFDTARAAH